MSEQGRARTSASPSTNSDMILVVMGAVAIGAAILAWGVSALALEVGAFLERGHWIDVAGWGPLLAYGNVQKPGVDLATAAAQHDAPNEGMWLFLVVIFGVIAVGALVAASMAVMHWMGHGRRRGFATPAERSVATSAAAVRRKSHIIRPSLAGVRRRRLHPREAGFLVGQKWGAREEVWLSHEDSLLVFGESGEGKTLRLAVPLARHLRGPMILFSSSEDLMRHLAFVPELRERPKWAVDFRGRTGLDGHPLGPLGLPRYGIDLVRGCESPQVAKLRSEVLVGLGYDVSAVREGVVWKERAISLVTYVLHAAALGGCDLAWVISMVNAERFAEVRTILERTPGAVPLWDAAVAHFAALAPETRSGVLFGAAAGLAALADNPDLLELCSGQGYPQFEVGRFFDESGMLFVLVPDEERLRVGPSVGAFVEGVIGVGKARAQRMPGKRLDPPLTVILDEMARCPLPSAAALAATTRKQGVTPIYLWQSPTQLRRAYGDHGAAEILDSMTTTMFLRGLRWQSDLEMVQTWLPEVTSWSASQHTDGAGRNSRGRSERREPALSTAEIRQLREGEGLLFTRGVPPVDVRLRGPWELPAKDRHVFEAAVSEYDAAVAAAQTRAA